MILKNANEFHVVKILITWIFRFEKRGYSDRNWGSERESEIKKD